MKVLLISPSEISYNPRLLKAADFLHAKGADVTVYNTVIGLVQEDIHNRVKSSRSWKLVERDITKRTFGSKLRWFYSGVVNRIGYELYKRFKSRLLFSHTLDKGYVVFPSSLKNEKFDYIIIHLVDTLPFAVKLKKSTGAKLIYDSQEYFVGQFESVGSAVDLDWVKEAEKTFAPDIDLVLATTNAMRFRLQDDFTQNKHFLRVRNTPLKQAVNGQSSDQDVLRIVWHGLTIVPENLKGVHILLKAVSLCKTPVHLHLQGNITESNLAKLNQMLKELNITDKVTLLKAADPDHIIPSLTGYDLGATGEMDVQENQRLTSSNKLFDYIYAGLAVIVPRLPGHTETIDEFNVGMIFEPGNSEDMARKIDELNSNRPLLNQFKQAARQAREKELYWEYDYEFVWDFMKSEHRQ